MVRSKYDNMVEKLENLMEKHQLLYEWLDGEKDIVLCVKPNRIDGEQTSFIEDSEGTSSSDAAISFIFKNGEIVINSCGKLFISEALMNKLKNIAKKLHYLYLQVYREEMMDAEETDEC